MIQYHSNTFKSSWNQERNFDDDTSDYDDRDPGREVIEKNIRNRLQRIADNTKEELNKVLQRVDITLNNYEYSVKSSLKQHGMQIEEMANVEHVADIKELEDLLNDSLAKQRYKQRLMIFIVGHAEQISEKSKLLQQVGQFFVEQRENFSGKDFNPSDDINEGVDEIDATLKSFDVKDCFMHVKVLGSKINELHAEIMEYLILNAGSKQQAKGKKKLAQLSKQTQEQLASVQSQLEQANTEMTNKDNKIQTLEQQIEKTQTQQNKLQEKLKQYEENIESYKQKIMELEDNIDEHKNHIDDLSRMLTNLQESQTKNVVNIAETNLQETEENVKDRIESTIDENVETTNLSNQEIIFNHTEDLPDLNVLFNPADGIDLNHVTKENLPTAYVNLRTFAIIRLKELLKELETNDPMNDEGAQKIKQEFDEYKIVCEQEKNLLIEKVDRAYNLQMKAEENLKNLELIIDEQKYSKAEVTEQETQTNLNEDIESNEQFRNGTLSDARIRDPSRVTMYINDISSESTLTKDKIPLHSLENSVVLNKQQLSMSPLDDQSNVDSIKVHEQLHENSEHLLNDEEKIHSKNIVSDEFKIGFHRLYEIIYKFRYSMMNLLEQNQFTTFAIRLQMMKQLSFDENEQTKDFIENSEYLLKEIMKILLTCMTTLYSTINEHKIREKEYLKQQIIPIPDSSSMDERYLVILQKKDSIINDLTKQYEQITNALNQTNKNHDEELNQNLIRIREQDKQIQRLQANIVHLQQRILKIETEGIVEPSILFTRLDIERNEHTLENAVHKGKISEKTSDEINMAMEEYIHLPSEQFRNLVRRYIQFRKAAELQRNMQHKSIDNETRNIYEKVETLYERRSHHISKVMSHIRQQRSNLAKVLTEKIDDLEEKSSIFLIRPLYSYQGRAAAQSYMIQVKRRHEAILKEAATKKRHFPSRLSLQSASSTNHRDENKYKSSSPSSPTDVANDDDPQFNIEKSFTPVRTSTEQSKIANESPATEKKVMIKIADVSRLQELDIQRTLMPVTHASTPLGTNVFSNTIDPCVPSLNLRSYVALSRPGAGYLRKIPIDAVNPLPREGHSALSSKTHLTNPRTPVNSSAGDLRRMSPALPPIKRVLTSGLSHISNERENSEYVPSIVTHDGRRDD